MIDIISSYDRYTLKIKRYYSVYVKAEEDKVIAMMPDYTDYNMSITGNSVEDAIERLTQKFKESTAFKIRRRPGEKIVKEVSIILDDFYKPILKYTGVELQEVMTRSRKKFTVIARNLLCYFLRQKFKMTYQEIGKTLDRHYSTIIHSINIIINDKAIYADIATIFNQIEGDLWQDQNLKD